MDTSTVPTFLACGAFFALSFWSGYGEQTPLTCENVRKLLRCMGYRSSQAERRLGLEGNHRMAAASVAADHIQRRRGAHSCSLS